MDVNKCDVVIDMRYCIIIPFLCILLIPRNQSEPTDNNHVVIVAAAKFRSAKKQQMKAHVGNNESLLVVQLLHLKHNINKPPCQEDKS